MFHNLMHAPSEKMAVKWISFRKNGLARKDYQGPQKMAFQCDSPSENFIYTAPVYKILSMGEGGGRDGLNIKWWFLTSMLLN